MPSSQQAAESLRLIILLAVNCHWLRVSVVHSSVPVPAWSGTVIPLRDTSLIHRSGCLSPTQIREYVNTRRTIHPPIHFRRPSVPCGCCACLEFIAIQCSVYVVTGILLSTSKDSSVRCINSSLTLNAILELNFVQCPYNSFCDSVT